MLTFFVIKKFSWEHMEVAMNKLTLLLAAFGLSLAFMTGCGKEKPLLSASDYELNPETHQTSRGIAPGDTSEAFLAAYGDYRFFTSIDGGDYQFLDSEEIPSDSSATTLLPTFFIDGIPIDPDIFCTENEIAKTDLLAFLSSEDYLQSHTVIYYYLVFMWEDGIITDIRSEYMDYNEDASYYQEFDPTVQ